MASKFDLTSNVVKQKNYIVKFFYLKNNKIVKKKYYTSPNIFGLVGLLYT